MIKKRDLPYCPVTTTLQIIGSKWKILILQELQLINRRFGDLGKTLHGISKHVLSATLKSLISDGIIMKKLIATSPRRVEYELTEIGRTLIPVLDAMKSWG